MVKPQVRHSVVRPSAGVKGGWLLFGLFVLFTIRMNESWTDELQETKGAHGNVQATKGINRYYSSVRWKRGAVECRSELGVAGFASASRQA